MNKKKICIILIFFAFILSFFTNNFISRKTNTSISNYALIESQRFATSLINVSISSVIKKEKIGTDILTITKNDKEEIQLIDFNTAKVNLLLEEISLEVQKNILRLENGDNSFLPVSKSLQGDSFKYVRNGTLCELKGGGFFGNSLFSNIGPSIPIKLSFIGEVLTGIKTFVKSYGINNAYLEVDVSVRVVMRITMPLSTKDKKITKNIPIAMKVIHGSVPNYYNDVLEKSSESYSLPLLE